MESSADAAWIIRAERLPYTGAGSCPHPRECGKGPALHIVPGVLTPVFAKHSNDLESLDAFISASKQLEPIPQFKATAKPARIPGRPVLAIVLAGGVNWPPLALSRTPCFRRPTEDTITSPFACTPSGMWTVVILVRLSSWKPPDKVLYS